MRFLSLSLSLSFSLVLLSSRSAEASDVFLEYRSDGGWRAYPKALAIFGPGGTPIAVETPLRGRVELSLAEAAAIGTNVPPDYREEICIGLYEYTAGSIVSTGELGPGCHPAVTGVTTYGPIEFMAANLTRVTADTDAKYVVFNRFVPADPASNPGLPVLFGAESSM